jgi:N utilization substance protein A
MDAKQSKQFLEAIEQISQQKGIEPSEIKDALEEVFTKMYHNKYDLEANIETVVDMVNGTIIMTNIKKVVEKIEDEYSEVTLDHPAVKKQKLKVGDDYREEVNYDEFSRSVAQQIKQMLIQKTREAEKKKIYEKFASRKDELILTKVYKVSNNYVILDIDGTSLFMPKSEMNPLEELKKDQTLRVYVLNIDKMAKDAQIVVSRATPNLVKRLMEEMIVDISDGIVEIMAIAREPGQKSKVIVKSNQPEVDPVGSCIGVKGSRIKGIIDEIGGERVDIIPYSEDQIEQIVFALSPAKVIGVTVVEEKEELPEER